MHSMKQAPYTRHELENIAESEFPARGEYCEGCKTLIPSFADVSTNDEHRIRAMESRVQQTIEVRRLTGCSIRWAKIWVVHPHGPQPKHGQNGPPCPECGLPLRTAKAMQCVECGADWH